MGLKVGNTRKVGCQDTQCTTTRKIDEHTGDPMTKQALIFPAVLTGLLISVNAHAGIERSCQAHFEIKINSSKLQLGQFETRRGCGSSVPNRCRRRARDQAHACMAKFYANGKKAPKECLGKAVKNFSNDWKSVGPKKAALIEAKSIGELMNGMIKKRSFPYSVYAVTTGGSGCKKRVKLGGGRTNDALPKNLFRIQEKTESYGKTNKTRKKLISKVTVKLPNNKKIIRTNFAPLQGSQILQNPERSYNGCGRHAAFHLLHWYGANLDFRKKVSPSIPLIKNLFNHKGRKAVSPGALRSGLTTLLNASKSGLVAKQFNRVTNPQKHIRQIIRTQSPVIALVENGQHYVTAMGYWAPVWVGSTKGISTPSAMANMWKNSSPAATTI